MLQCLVKFEIGFIYGVGVRKIGLHSALNDVLDIIAGIFTILIGKVLHVPCKSKYEVTRLPEGKKISMNG